jgi:hypothetical protein
MRVAKKDQVMERIDLLRIAQAIVRRAQRDGFIVPTDIRAELTKVGLENGHAQEVLALAKPSLRYRRGRYYYVSAAVGRLRDRVRKERLQTRELHCAVRELVAAHQKTARIEKRGLRRVQFIHPVQVVARDGRTFHFISLDLSLSGIRLLGNCSLARQRVTVHVPKVGGGVLPILVSILWARPVGDGLIQQGGIFLGQAEGK